MQTQRFLKGGAEFPTRGKGVKAQARERLFEKGTVSGFGANPEPTATVRMKENGRGATRRSVCRDSGP